MRPLAMCDDHGMRSHCGSMGYSMCYSMGYSMGCSMGYGLPMTVALPQPVAQANLPRSRACQRECQSVCGWLATARGCFQRPLALCSNSAAAGRLGRGARSAVWPVGCGARPAF
jgi:hypothetical protein